MFQVILADIIKYSNYQRKRTLQTWSRASRWFIEVKYHYRRTLVWKVIPRWLYCQSPGQDRFRLHGVFTLLQMYLGVKCPGNIPTPPCGALYEFQTLFSCGTIFPSSPGIWSLIKWVSATSFQLFCSLRICFLSTSQRHWIVSSPGTSAFYITSTAQKTPLFVQFSLAPSLVSVSSLLDDGATICLYIIPPSLLCIAFSIWLRKICKWEQRDVLLNALFAVFLQTHTYSCLVSKTGKH